MLVPIKRKALDLQYIYTLNEAGQHSWELIDGKKNLKQIAVQLTEEFKVDFKSAVKDLVELIQGLEKSNLILPVRPNKSIKWTP